MLIIVCSISSITVSIYTAATATTMCIIMHVIRCLSRRSRAHRVAMIERGRCSVTVTTAVIEHTVNMRETIRCTCISSISVVSSSIVALIVIRA